jgi:hypothetical protein
MWPVMAASNQRGPNILVDGDCEAVGVAAWSVINATLSKQGSAYEGAQCLRVERTGAAGQAYQSVVTIGRTYRLTGVMRGDSTNNPIVGNVGSSVGDILVTGTASTSWQVFDVIFIAGDARIRFYSQTTNGNHVEFDALYLSEVV